MKNRIRAFCQLGEKINNLTPQKKQQLFIGTANENPWFTPDNIELSLQGVSKFLTHQALEPWLANYNLRETAPQKIGVAMAGNIPLVGFHDLLCVLLSGHHLTAKLSSGDTVLMKYIIQTLIGIDSEFSNLISVEERLNTADALIATGSDNTSRYFEYYFRNTPHIIRKNRTSCAILQGEETDRQLSKLGKDIFSYFGLGCRNVSKIFVPENFDFAVAIKSWETYQPIVHHHKYANNYDYQKSILLINKIPFYDSGFLLITENQNIVSPISVLYYETYTNPNDLAAKLKSLQNKIQCVVSASGWFENSIPFGEAQLPGVSQYADDVDTMDFLQRLQ